MKEITKQKKRFAVSNLTQNELFGYMFILPALIALVALVVYPLLYGFYISFFETNLSNKWNFIGLSNYSSLFRDFEFVQRVLFTFKYTFVVVLFHFVIGGALALLLNKQRRGTTIFRTVLTLPWLFPEVVIALLFKWIFNPLYGILNNFLLDIGAINDYVSWLGSTDFAFFCVALVSIWKGFPFVMINILAGLQSVSKDLVDASKIDGANAWQSLVHVSIPTIKPVLITALILDTVWWFKHYTMVWLLTQGGPGNTTAVLSISVYKEAFEYFNYGRAAAMAVFIFIICYLISLVYRRVFDNE
ncbi:sugar ABC transporter permease [uncultured Sphaerochaeta sp.]|uniref:carbohydrate ABC transporter permease n=1 Tax=uncultured Sphaerochaeta sp. TaxID=886478 RepID=UPI002AA60F88|nr:sugar ABC transporter permease [uncultured Sphaerochaeta sp.]